MKLHLKFLFFSLSLILFSCSSEQEGHDNDLAARCFKFEFGLDPKLVNDIYAKQLVKGDAARAWYKFRANEKLIDQLKDKGFTVSSAEEFDRHSGGGYSPIWWEIDNKGQFYLKNKWSANFADSTAVFSYNKETEEVFFCHDGID